MSDIGQEDFRVEVNGGKYTAIRLVGGGTRWMRHGEHWEAATQDWQFAGAINCLIDELHAARTRPPGREAEIQGVDGTVRKAHYGSGRQPWDDMIDLDWGPHFAAGCALKYVRRFANKNGQDDLDKGIWYYNELLKRAGGECNGAWTKAFAELEDELSLEERRLLRGVKTGIPA